jgi:adenylate kinase family enzyme
MRIYIIGTGRSGKSFLAEQMSKNTGIRHYDLDDIVFIEVGKKERSVEQRRGELKRIILLNSWIIEGVFTEDWVIPALEQADKIIYIETPALTKLLRFFKKAFNRKDGFKDFYGRILVTLGIKYKNFDRTRQRYEKLLKPFKNKVLNIKNKEDIKSKSVFD